MNTRSSLPCIANHPPATLAHPRPFWRRTSTHFAAAALFAGCLFSVVDAEAASGTLPGLTADAVTLKNTSSGALSVSGQTTTYLQVGNSGSGSDEAVVYVFQIPAAVLSDASQVFDTASFTVRLGSNAMPGTTGGDLYGLGYRTSATVLASDFYKGTLDPNAALVMDNFLTSSSPAYGSVTTSADVLADYLNAQLAAARTAGAAAAYIFLRISPDATTPGGHALLAMADQGGTAAPSLAYSTTTVGFRNVAVGGGGYVTGIFADPQVSGLFYARTDVGGAYRWDAAGSRWIPITEMRSNDDFGIESLAVDPVNARTLYILTGKYIYSTPHLYKSTDAGDTWSTLTVPAGLDCLSNGTGRIYGERLQVDPNNPSVLFLASRNIGLWKSVDGGASWTKVNGVPIGDTSAAHGGDAAYAHGLSYVIFDKGGGTTGGASSTIYAGVYNTVTGNTEGGVYKTTNGGATWTQMLGGARSPTRAAVASDGTFYGTFTGTSPGGIWKAARNSVSLTDVSPATATAYCAVAANPTNASEVLVSQNVSTYGSNTWRTTTAGLAWTVTGRVKGAANPVTRDSSQWFGNISSLVYNPFKTSEVWLGDFVGVLRTPNIADNAVPWDYLYRNHEEIVPLTLVCAPSGAPLLSGDADINGVRHADVAVIPAKGFMTSSTPSSFGSTTGMDFCEANPTVWARVLDIFYGSGHGYFSTDDGQNWTKFASEPAGATGGRIAVSATNSNNFVWVPENGVVSYTTDQGVTWHAATGAPNVTSAEFSQNAQALVSDRVAAGTFYLYKDVYGSPNGYAQIYKSTDGGANWAKAGTCPYVGNHTNAYQYKIVSAPGVSGEVWVNIGYVATYKSYNGGTSFSAASGVSSVGMIAFGKAAPGHSNPALFVRGSAGGLSGTLRSDDDGATWKKIDDAANPVNDSPKVIGADRQTFGRVYLGTDGRGIYVGDSN